MKIRTLGLALIIVGIMAIVFTGFNYVSTKRVAEIGSLKIDKEKDHRIQWPHVVGFVLVAGGVVALFSARRNSVN